MSLYLFTRITTKCRFFVEIEFDDTGQVSKLFIGECRRLIDFYTVLHLLGIFQNDRNFIAAAFGCRKNLIVFDEI